MAIVGARDEQWRFEVRRTKAICNCNDGHPVNARRGDGVAVALWTCPEHGNVFEEIPLGITLNWQARAVLQAISDEYKAGRPATIDAISKKLNFSTWATERAWVVLQSVNFIEGLGPSIEIHESKF